MMSNPLPSIPENKPFTTWGIIEGETVIVEEKHIPVCYGFLLDKSGSMQGIKYKSAEDAIRTILIDYHDSDMVFMIQFDDRFEVKTEPTLVSEVRKNGIDHWFKVVEMGGTKIWDAIDQSLKFAQKGMQTIINVITDGEDNNSRCTESYIKKKVSEIPDVSLNIVMIANSEQQAPVAAYQNAANGMYSQLSSDDGNLSRNITQAISSSSPATSGSRAASRTLSALQKPCSK